MTEAVWTELRVAARTLRKTPSFTAGAVLTIALGIGTSTAVFSVVYGILFRPLPYRDADRLVVIAAERDYAGRPRPEPTSFGLVDYEEWRSRSRVFESLAFMAGSSYALSDSTGSRTIDAADVTASFFSTLGGHVALGRGLGDGDAGAIVISHRLWQSHFGGSPDAIGRTLTLTARPYTIVGVAGADFQIPSAQPDAWVLVRPPLGTDAARRGVGSFTPIGRLKDGVTVAQAGTDAQRIIDALRHDYPARYDHIRATAVSIHDRVVGSVRSALLIVFAAVGLVLFVACANVANLMLARNATRARDIAIRTALGASRTRLLGQSLADAALVASIGAVCGMLAATVLVHAAVRLAPMDTPRLIAIQLDWPVLLFAAAATAVTALFVGVLPAFESRPTADALKAAVGTTSGAPGAARLRSALIVVEMAVSIVLLVGATLFGRSLVRLMGADLGVAADHVALARIELAYGRSVDPPRQIELMKAIVARVRTLPGVVDAAGSASLPPNAGRLRLTMTSVADADRPMANYLVDAVTVTPGFFSTLRVPLLHGRFFTDADDGRHPPVMIMSADTVRMLFSDPNPIGRTLSLPSTVKGGSNLVTLVGVIANVKYSGLDAAPNGAIYVPYAQQPWPSMFVLARTVGDPASVSRSIASAAWGVDRGITIAAVDTLDSMVSEAASQPRFRTVLLASCATLALLLAAAGLYGVVAYTVSRRTTEIGIRMALGAGAADIIVMIVGEGARLSVGGIVVGIAAAFALTRLVSGLLYGIAPADPLSFVVSAAVLLAIALLAAYLPARRAADVDPLVALRVE